MVGASWYRFGTGNNFRFAWMKDQLDPAVGQYLIRGGGERVWLTVTVTWVTLTNIAPLQNASGPWDQASLWRMRCEQLNVVGIRVSDGLTRDVSSLSAV